MGNTSRMNSRQRKAARRDAAYDRREADLRRYQRILAAAGDALSDQDRAEFEVKAASCIEDMRRLEDK